jgi:non-ribosomal peptide synthetase component F
VIGIMAIELSGGAYCPLSPRDPPARLQTLLKETDSRVIVVHDLTEDKFNIDDCSMMNVDTTMNREEIWNDADLDRLSRIMVTGESRAYVIFTSGSTGVPKAVSLSTLLNRVKSLEDCS